MRIRKYRSPKPAKVGIKMSTPNLDKLGRKKVKPVKVGKTQTKLK